MIQHKTYDKISPIVKCSPTVYTFTAAIFAATTPIIVVSIMHTPLLSLKVALAYSSFGLIFSIIQ
jgi:uncharacterized membrane protein YccC